MVLTCGLMQVKSKEPVPLEDIKLDVEVNGLAAHARLTLEYTNKEENPIEAVYVMPVDDEASVCGFRAKVGDRSIIAKIQEKQEARDTYDDAIASGQTAYLMEESDESSDIVKICIGNLAAQSSATLEIDFVLELRMEGNDRCIFDFPQVLMPRYSPLRNPNISMGESSGQNLSAEVPRLQPGEKTPYKFNFSGKVYAPCPLKNVESPHQDLSVIYSDDKRSATVSLAKEHDLQSNIQLHIVTEKPFKAYGVVEMGDQGVKDNEFMSNPVIMLNFFPEFPDAKLEETPCEMVFIVDRSGSMSGSPMEAAQETLLLCLKSLPSNCYFNVIGFGNRFETLFPQSLNYTDESLDKACDLAKLMVADLGGTEILKPMKWVYSQPIIKGYSRQVFLLTDGGVSNTQEVIKTVADNAKMARTFSIGIGQGVSTSLVKGVAKAGKGRCEFVTGNERLQKKVIMLLKCALQPALRNLEIEWKLPQHCTVQQIPAEMGSLFKGEKLVVYGRLQHTKDTVETKEIKGEAVIKGQIGLSSDKEASVLSSMITLTMKLNDSKSRQLPMLHHLAGKKRIKDIAQCNDFRRGENESAKQELIDMSKDSNVISPHTSFIAVDEKTANPIEKPMMQRIIPQMPAMNLCRQYAMASFGAAKGVKKTKKKSVKSVGLLSALKSGGERKARMKTKASPPAKYSLLCSAIDEGKNQSSHNGNSMIHVISLQRAAGNWLLSDELLNLLNQTREKLNDNSVTRKLSLSNERDGCLLATALVLVWLVEKHGDNINEWEIIAEKAKKWMRLNIKEGLTPEELMSLTYTIIAS